MKVQVTLPNAQSKSGKQLPNTSNNQTKRPSAAKLGVSSPRRLTSSSAASSNLSVTSPQKQQNSNLNNSTVNSGLKPQSSHSSQFDVSNTSILSTAALTHQNSSTHSAHKNQASVNYHNNHISANLATVKQNLAKNEAFNSKINNEYEKEISLLKQEVSQLEQKLKDAEKRENNSKQIYEMMIESFYSAQKVESENYTSNNDKLNKVIRLSDLQINDPISLNKPQSLSKDEDLKLKVKSLNLKLEETQRKLLETETTLKLLQKDYDFLQKDSQTSINHYRLDNSRLREQLQNERDRSVNEIQLTLEERQDRENQQLKDIQTKFETQIEDIKTLHLREKASLEEECQRLKSELKFLRFEHSELITNTNVEKQITNLHDEYMSEIQSLNQQLAFKSQETFLLFEQMQQEKLHLQQKINELQNDVQKMKENKDKIKEEYSKKTNEMKEKLEKAFVQLTANDEAAGELQKLRSQIKEMQEKISHSKRNSMIQSEMTEMTRKVSQSQYIQQNEGSAAPFIDIKKVESLAQNLQSQIGALREDNEKLRKELKHSLNTVRSASPPVKNRKNTEYQQNNNEEVKDNLMSTRKKKSNRGKFGFASPQTQSSRKQDGNQSISNMKIEDQSQRIKKTKGFLDSQRINRNLNIQSPQNLLTFQSQEEQSNSLQNSPQNKEMTQLFAENQIGATARLFQKAKQGGYHNAKNSIFANNGLSSNDLSGLTLNTTNVTSDYNAGLGQSRYFGNQSVRQISKKNISQSLSSNHLFASPTNSSLMLQRLQSHIQYIKCSNCKMELAFDEFMQHSNQCMMSSGQVDLSQQRLDSQDNLAEISPIKSRNKLQRINSASSASQKRQQQQSLVFERVQQPREYDSYLDLNEDCSTEAGNFKFQYGVNQIGQINNQSAQRPSFLSSVDYNSFMEKGVSYTKGVPCISQAPQNFSPETLDRQNIQLQSQNNPNQTVYTQKHIKKLEDRARFFEMMFRQSQESLNKISEELKKKDFENEKLILDLKQTKIHIALLEETTAQRELMLKNEIQSLRHKDMMTSQSQPEIKIHVNTTNYSCFNIGGSKVQNTHEIKIEPTLLASLQQNNEKFAQPTPTRTPQQTLKKKAQDIPEEQIYQETAPTSGHQHTFSKKEFENADLKCPPKRLRSMEKQQSSTEYTNQSFHNQTSNYQGYAQSFLNSHDYQSSISQDVQPEGKPSLENHMKLSRQNQPYVFGPQRGLGSPKILTTRCSPKSQALHK